MNYGYARVSTRTQAKEGNSLENQIKLLKEAGATKIYTDSYTGKVTERPELSKLIAEMKSGDKFIVCKMDRFARSVNEGSELIKQLQKKGIIVHVLNLGVMDTTPTGRLITNIMLSFAEFESDMIRERTLQGRQESGNWGGRPKKYGRAKIDHAVELLNNYSYNQVVEMTGISKSTLQRAKRKECDRLVKYSKLLKEDVKNE